MGRRRALWPQFCYETKSKFVASHYPKKFRVRCASNCCSLDPIPLKCEGCEKLPNGFPENKDTLSLKPNKWSKNPGFSAKTEKNVNVTQSG